MVVRGGQSDCVLYQKKAHRLIAGLKKAPFLPLGPLGVRDGLRKCDIQSIPKALPRIATSIL